MFTGLRRAIIGLVVSSTTRRPATTPCPLCGSRDVSLLYEGSSTQWRREFHGCAVCDLVFVPPGCHLSPEEERAHYLKHRNDPDDPGYRAFLRRLWDALKPHLDRGLYMNFLHNKEVIERTQEAFPRESYQRLVELKRKYDPKNIVRSGFNFGAG